MAADNNSNLNGKLDYYVCGEEEYFEDIHTWMIKLIKDEYKELIKETARNFNRLHELIEEQQDIVISKLESKMEQALKEAEKHREKIMKYNLSKQQLNNEESINKIDKDIKKHIDELLKPNIVRLEWSKDIFEETLSNFCLVQQHKKFVNTYWAAVSRGEDEEDIETPRSLAIDPIEGRIYVVDSGDYTDRIQVYNSTGEYIETFDGQGEIVCPFGIYLYDQSLYVSCMDTPNETDVACIVKLDKNIGEVLASVKTDDPIYGLFVDSYGPMVKIYGCGTFSHLLYSYSDEMELIEDPVKLNTDYVDTNNEDYSMRSCAMSVKVFGDKIYLLLTCTEYPVQVFNPHGILLSKLIDNAYLNDPISFCFDIYNNIIIADRGDHQVLVYSSKHGKLLRKIGEGTGMDLGQFLGPKGIVLGLQNEYVVLDSKDQFMLQAF